MRYQLGSFFLDVMLDQAMKQSVSQIHNLLLFLSLGLKKKHIRQSMYILEKKKVTNYE